MDFLQPLVVSADPKYTFGTLETGHGRMRDRLKVLLRCGRPHPVGTAVSVASMVVEEVVDAIRAQVCDTILSVLGEDHGVR
jgi:hypothetical protein